MTASASSIQQALSWLSEYVGGRLEHLLLGSPASDPRPLELMQNDRGLGDLVEQLQPTLEEFVIILLALVPHLEPDLIDHVVARLFPEGNDVTALGGIRTTTTRTFLPSGQTAVFILAGRDVEARLNVQRMLSAHGRLVKSRLVWLEGSAESEPMLSGRLCIDMELVELLLMGQVAPPRFSQEFPAEHLGTAMDWDDLVLPETTMLQIREIMNWITYNEQVIKDPALSARVKPGYRALFYGPPGTGKTLTATLLGKHTGREVFRIDLSRVVSKYIGETEKNLSRLFDRAEHKDWILFFDEADALFGKRTEVRDSHDKYANQEVSYLLQRIESFDGLVILATNQRMNIDDAFVRRFQSIIHFPMPRAEERLRLWARGLPQSISVAPDVDLNALASQYELSGASIVNIILHCSIQTIAGGTDVFTQESIVSAITREFIKEGRIV